MNKLLEWVFEEAPIFIVVCVYSVLFTITAFLISATLWSLSTGLWVIPVFMWGVIPAYLVYLSYKKDHTND